MTNSNDIKGIAYSLEDILETPVSEKLVSLLTQAERAEVCSIKYQWTRGSKTAHQELIEMLNLAKSRLPKSYKDIPKVKEYLKIKFNK
jgi:hypothetical protein